MRATQLAPPPATSSKDMLAAAFRAARADVSTALGLMPAPISSRDIAERAEQAERMHARWPTGVAMRPATEAEILWIYGHSARRGLAEPFLPDGTEPAVRGRGRTVAALGEMLLAEGGADLNSRRPVPGTPFQRRYLQVSSEWGDSYRTMLALSEMPEAFALPGAAYLQQLDDLAHLAQPLQRRGVVVRDAPVQRVPQPRSVVPPEQVPVGGDVRRGVLGDRHHQLPGARLGSSGQYGNVHSGPRVQDQAVEPKWREADAVVAGAGQNQPLRDVLGDGQQMSWWPGPVGVEVITCEHRCAGGRSQTSNRRVCGRESWWPHARQA
ncbi:hypothetical protein [Streptomyces sp. NPDC002520]